jgi:hypothetical protein
MASDEGKLPKHHYVPVFYLKEWLDESGRLYEYSRPTGTEVKARDCGPRGTGYVRGLYRLEYGDEARAEAFEKIFFGQVDTLAKQARDVLLGDLPETWDVDLRSAWSRFLLGMMFRNPERISALRKLIEDITLESYEEYESQYDAIKGENDPQTYLDYLVRHVVFSALDWTAEMMQRPALGQHLNNMRWLVKDVTDCGIKLFTSDRPIIMTNGLAHDSSELVIPVSPYRAFIACNTTMVENDLRQMSSTNFARALNERILSRAKKYAWNCTADLINSANRLLSVDSEETEKFWNAPPAPRPGSGEQAAV